MSPPLLPPPPRSANASRTPTPTPSNPTGIANSTSSSSFRYNNSLPKQIGTSSPTHQRTVTDSSLIESDTSFGSFEGQGVILGGGQGDSEGSDGRDQNVDLMSFDSPNRQESRMGRILGPPLPSNVQRLPAEQTRNLPTETEHDLLGSWEDQSSHLSNPSLTSAHTTHHNGILPSKTPIDALEEELLRSKLSHNGTDDPRLQPYTGPTASLPPPSASSSAAPSPLPIPTPPSSLSRSTSSSYYGKRSPGGPPRRLSQMESFVGPSSPPAVSAGPGDSFVFYARAHSSSAGGGGGRSNGWPVVEQGMEEEDEDDYEQGFFTTGDLLGDSSDQPLPRKVLQKRRPPPTQTEDAEAGFRRLSASSSTSPPSPGFGARRLSASFLRGPSGVGRFPSKKIGQSPSPGRSPPNIGGNGGGKGGNAGTGRGRGGHERGVTMPEYSREYDADDHPFTDEPEDDGSAGGGGGRDSSEWGRWGKSPTRQASNNRGGESTGRGGGGGSASESNLASMSKKFGLSNLSGATSKATDQVKSKWKTVMGPSSFSGNSPTLNLFHSASPTSHLSAIEQDKIRELDKPSNTAQPIAVNSRTPFHLRSGSGSGSGDGFYNATGASWIAPSGAPGYRNPNGIDEKLFPTPGQNGHERLEDWSGTILLGRRDQTLAVLDQHTADVLRPFLPARQRLSNKWTLLFSLDQHGASLSTFYRLIEGFHTNTDKHKGSGNLLIVRDSEDRRFGVYMNEQIKRMDGSYYGSGESWLFKIIGRDMDVRARPFKWTGRNQYFALCEGGFISFGGGDGRTGLYLDAAFVNGSSGRCPAYDNEVLCAEEGDGREKARFECVGLEVWGTS